MRSRIWTIAPLLGIAALGVMGWLVWRVSFGLDRTEASVQRLRDRGYLPADARIVLANDTHGGLHGDGTTFIVFECSPECLSAVRSEIGDDHDYRLSVNPHEDWQRQDDAVERTLDMTFPEGNDRSVLPDTASPDVEFRCIGRITRPFSYCTSLYAIDHELGRFWYMNITT